MYGVPSPATRPGDNGNIVKIHLYITSSGYIYKGWPCSLWLNLHDHNGSAH